jgi:hypothetical protein
MSKTPGEEEDRIKWYEKCSRSHSGAPRDFLLNIRPVKELHAPKVAKEDRISWYDKFYRSHSGAPRDFLHKLDEGGRNVRYPFTPRETLSGFLTTRQMLEQSNEVCIPLSNSHPEPHVLFS